MSALVGIGFRGLAVRIIGIAKSSVKSFLGANFCAAATAAMLVVGAFVGHASAQQPKQGATCRTPQVEARIKELEVRVDHYENYLYAAMDAEDEANKNYWAAVALLNDNPNSPSAKSKFNAASEKYWAASAKVKDLRAKLEAYRDELARLKALPPCENPKTAPWPDGGGGGRYAPRWLQPSEMLTQAPPTFGGGYVGGEGMPPYIVEASAYGGSIAASSFGSNFNPDVFGGRLAVRIPEGSLRLQADVQGEGTSNYSSMAGYRSYVAWGAHADWMWTRNTEVGAFGGFQDAATTFFGPPSTNYFIGLEGRQFFGPAMVGAQFGRFGVADGPGTLTDTWFAEGRAKFSVGRAFGLPSLEYTIVGAELGYGSGTDATLSVGAQTTYWGLGLMQGIANTPVSLFVNFDHFENRVSGLGTVWNESMITGGVKIAFPSTDLVRGWIEPTEPLPLILRTVTNF